VAGSDAVQAVDRKVKIALDETRLLILGAQILFGFHLNAAFQPGFSKLGQVWWILYTCSFAAIAVGVGLLIAPSMEHRIVEHGRSSGRIIAQTNRLAALALLPLAFSLGADLAIVFAYRFGTIAGVTIGGLATTLALVFWYGAAWAIRKPRKGANNMAEHDTPIDVRVEHMLTEARVLLPGAQALFGFQMAVLLTDAFGDLPPSSKVLHAVALCCIATSIILLMSPAAFHRIAYGGENTETFHRIGSGFVIASVVPLAAGITSDLYVSIARALDSAPLGAAVAGVVGLVLVGLWIVQPLVLRGAHPRRRGR
jgi:hypothetical protein